MIGRMAMDDRVERDIDVEARRRRRQIIVAAVVVGSVLMLFALLTVLMFVFRWQLMPEPWKVI